jgi:xylitol oxidase
MDKRQFLKTSGALITGGVLSRLVNGEQQPEARTNWSGNYRYSTERLHLPRTVEEVQQVVKKCNKLKALGARHSFNGIADSRENQISLKLLDQIALDPKSRTVTVGGGVTYGQLAPYIDGLGFAVHN